MNDKDTIKLTCPECKNDFILSYGRYRRFPKDHKFLCSTCWKKYLSTKFNKLTDEEKKQWQQKMQNGSKNRTEEQKAIASAKSSIIMKKYWNNMSEEERKIHANHIKVGIRNKSQKEKIAWKQKISNSQKDIWAKLSIEQRKEKMKSLFKGSHDYWDNITPEELERNHQLISESLKQYFATANPEELCKRWEKISIASKNNWKKLSEASRLEHMQKMWDACSSIGPTEYQFIDILKIYGLYLNIDFIQQFNTLDIKYIHPDYFSIFGKINPITKNENYPYHAWDFCIYTKNGLNILVDIDGSIHDSKPSSMVTNHNTGEKFSLRDFIIYQDSKRPYQIPPGYIAYVVKCYNDILTNNCPVCKVTTDTSEEFLFKDFISIIQLYRLTDKELHKMINA